MAVNTIGELAKARAEASQTASMSDDLPELTQEYIAWHETNLGPLTHSNYTQINRFTQQGSRKAVRLTRRAVNNLINLGIAFEDIEPYIKEGVFVYTSEMMSPSTTQATAKPVPAAEAAMIDYFYSVNLVKA